MERNPDRVGQPAAHDPYGSRGSAADRGGHAAERQEAQQHPEAGLPQMRPVCPGHTQGQHLVWGLYASHGGGLRPPVEESHTPRIKHGVWLLLKYWGIGGRKYMTGHLVGSLQPGKNSSKNEADHRDYNPGDKIFHARRIKFIKSKHIGGFKS